MLKKYDKNSIMASGQPELQQKLLKVVKINKGLQITQIVAEDMGASCFFRKGDQEMSHLY